MTYTEAKAIIRHWRHMTAWGDPNRDLIRALVRKEAEIEQLKAQVAALQVEVQRLSLFVALHSPTQSDPLRPPYIVTCGTDHKRATDIAIIGGYRISFTDPTAQGTAIAPPGTQDGR